MAEKDEKIEISKYDLSKKEWNGDIPIDIHKVYTRQEAIERMANVIRKKLFKNEGPTQKIKEEGLEQEYNRYVDVMCECIAEAALNALLEAQNER